MLLKGKYTVVERVWRFMCGIFGTFNMDISDEKLDFCVNLLAHRGPDGRGVWRDEHITMGHRRLAILDLSDNGKQPMIYADGRYIIVYNGEIYNYIELKRELELKGYSFRSSCDTEVVLASFVEWKEKCNLKFNGMWAFAIWDRCEKKLFLSRDRFGVKPLYLYIKNSGDNVQLAFASEMKALMPLIDKPVYDKELIMNRNIVLKYENTTRCVIKQITRVKAGTYFWIQKDRIKSYRWWNTSEHLLELPKSYADQTEYFRELFVSACKLRMRSDVTLGTALSGGLDSSATISTMAHISKESGRCKQDWQHAYTAVFPRLPLNEYKYARKVTDYLGIDNLYIPIKADDFIKNIRRDTFLFEDVYITPPTPMMKVYRKMKEDGVTVTLDGHGADELFCGYDMTVPYAFLDAGNNPFKIMNIAKIYKNLFSEKGQNWHKDVGSLLNVYLQHSKTGKDLSEEKRQYVKTESKIGQWNSMDNLNKELYYQTHYSILPTLLRNYDRYSMANGVEIRMPFLDYRIVCFAFSLEWNSKLRNGFTKAVIRDALKEFMPKEITYRTSKIGFSSPLLEWMRGDLQEFIFDTINSSDFRQSELTRNLKCIKMYKRILNDDSATQLEAEVLWSELNPYFWERFYYNEMVK